MAWGVEGVAAARLRGPFTDVEVQHRTLPWCFPSARAARTFLEQHSPVHVAVSVATTAEATKAAFDALERFHAQHADADGRVDAQASYLVVTATRP